jgi:2-keto-4-pentenoate hydratase
MAFDLDEIAGVMLAHYDARAQSALFGEPIDLSIDKAYAIQAKIARLRTERGERIIGFKVGCTSPAIQKQLGVKEPIFGRIFESECQPSGVSLAWSRYANLAIEGELAVRLARDLPAEPLADAEYAEAIGSVFPVIELHHYVRPQNVHPGAGLIASGGMHAGFVYAEYETAVTRRLPLVEDIEVIIDQHSVGKTAGPWTMGSPAATLRWLSARLGASGLGLARGDVILTGSALPLYPVGRGSQIEALAGGLGRSCAAID